MPLVAAQCTNCGAALQVDNTKDAAVCQYCGSAFVIEKAIHNYEINNQYKIENANIIIKDENSIEQRLNAADKYLYELQEYDRAYQLYSEIESLAPTNFKMWYGKISSKTHNFDFAKTADLVVNHRDAYKELQRDLDNACRTVPAEDKQAFCEQITTLLEGCQKQLQQMIDNADSQKNATGRKKEEYGGESANLQEQNNAMIKQIDSLRRKRNALKSLKGLFLVLMILSIIVGGIITVLAVLSILGAMVSNGSVSSLSFTLLAIGIVPPVACIIIHKILKNKIQENIQSVQAKESQIESNKFQVKQNDTKIKDSIVSAESYGTLAQAYKGYITELDSVIQKYKL